MAGDKYDTIFQELVNLPRVSLQTVFRLYIKASKNTLLEVFPFFFWKQNIFKPSSNSTHQRFGLINACANLPWALLPWSDVLTLVHRKNTRLIVGGEKGNRMT